MMYSKIEDNKVFFRYPDKEWTPIDQIEKKDILKLLFYFKENDEFRLAEYNKEAIQNTAHEIIYRNIYEKFEELEEKRDLLKDSSNNLYREAINKYSSE